MKAQFSPGRLRLRANRAEMEALMVSGSLDAAIDWPGGGWRVRVLAAEAFGADGEGGRLTVRLPRDELENLSRHLPARDGLCHTFSGPAGNLELRFEVDLHDGRGRPR